MQLSLITLHSAVSSVSLPISSNRADVHRHGSLMSMRAQAVMTLFTRAFTVQVPVVSSIQQAQNGPATRHALNCIQQEYSFRVRVNRNFIMGMPRLLPREIK